MSSAGLERPRTTTPTTNRKPHSPLSIMLHAGENDQHPTLKHFDLVQGHNDIVTSYGKVYYGLVHHQGASRRKPSQQKVDQINALINSGLYENYLYMIFSKNKSWYHWRALLYQIHRGGCPNIAQAPGYYTPEYPNCWTWFEIGKFYTMSQEEMGKMRLHKDKRPLSDLLRTKETVGCQASLVYIEPPALIRPAGQHGV